MSIFSKLFGGDKGEEVTPYVPPVLDVNHIEGVQVRETWDKLPTECDECKRVGVSQCATHMAEFRYITQEARDQQGGKFRWYCDPHTSQEVNKAQDVIRRKQGS